MRRLSYHTRYYARGWEKGQSFTRLIPCAQQTNRICLSSPFYLSRISLVELVFRRAWTWVKYFWVIVWRARPSTEPAGSLCMLARTTIGESTALLDLKSMRKGRNTVAMALRLLKKLWERDSVSQYISHFVVHHPVFIHFSLLHLYELLRTNEGMFQDLQNHFKLTLNSPKPTSFVHSTFTVHYHSDRSWQRHSLVRFLRHIYELLAANNKLKCLQMESFCSPHLILVLTVIVVLTMLVGNAQY